MAKPDEGSSDPEAEGNRWEQVARNVAVAIGFVGAGVLSFTVSGPLGIWPIIWLPAGIGVTVFLVWGIRVLPGVLVGAIAIYSWELWNSTVGLSSSLLTLAVGGCVLGSVGSAWLASSLIRRGPGWPESLSTEWGAVRFFLTGSLVAGVASTLVILGFWLPIGLVPRSAILLFIVNQSLSQALGVAVLAPILFLACGEWRTLWRGFAARILLPLLVAVGASIALLGYVSRSSILEIQIECQEKVNSLVAAVERQGDGHVEVLNSIHSLWDSSEEVEESEFAAFVQLPLSRKRGLIELCWAPEIGDGQFKGFEEYLQEKVGPEAVSRFRESSRINRENGDGDASNAGAVFPVLFAENGTGARERIGSNILAIPAIRDALPLVRGNREAWASESFELDGVSTLAVLQWIERKPMAKGGGGELSLSDCSGIAIAILDIGQFLDLIAERSEGGNYDIALSDQGWNASRNSMASDFEPREIYRRSKGHEGNLPRESFWRQFELAGRQYELLAVADDPHVTSGKMWEVVGAQMTAFLLVNLLGILLMSAVGRTERVRREVAKRTSELAEAKRESEEASILLENFFGVSLDLLCLAGMDGFLKKVNASFVQTLGYPREKLLDRPFLELIHPDDIEDTLSTMEGLAEGEMVLRFQNRYRHHDGHYLWLEWCAVPDAERDLIYAAARDVTLRRKVEDELRRSNSELEQFAYVASHDLQEPLRMVTSFVQLLKRRYDDQLDQDANEYIEHAVNGAERMRRLIHGLLELSRIQRKGSPFSWVESRTALDDSIENLAVAIKENDARIEIGKLPEVMADPEQLTRLFQNLLGNAIRFSGEKAARVSVGASMVDGEWRFSVEDNGIGIPPSQRERVFEVFQRLHTRTEIEGTGIGLTICRKIVERHGGRIWIEEGSEGGTLFVFTISDRGPQPDQSVVKE